MHEIYRSYFNAIDLFNRSCFGSFTLQFAVLTKSWSRRMFLAMLGMCETNAQNAYKEVGPVERYQWLNMLANKLINNPWVEEEAGPSPPPAAATPATPAPVPATPAAAPPPGTITCQNYYRLRGQVKCGICEKKT